MKRWKTAGFSLIEVLIVIAVLGILATLILAAVTASRNKAYDTRIRNAVGQIRWLAESVFDTQGGSYVNWTQHDTISTNLNILLEDIDLNYGDVAGAPYIATIRESQENEYCVSAPLKSESDKHYCIDATGVFKTVSSICPDYPSGGQALRCPSN